MNKLGTGGMEFIASVLRLPTRDVWEVKGGEIECNQFDDLWGPKKEKVKLFKDVVRFQSLFDEIEIQDSTNAKEKYEEGYQVVEAISRTNRTLPTIIKYSHKDKDRRLFISIPEYLEPGIFWKEYATTISKIHKDFYQRTYKGRPKEMSQKIMLIKKALEKYKGKDLSQIELANKAYEELGSKINITAITLYKHYRKPIREVKEGDTGNKK